MGLAIERLYEPHGPVSGMPVEQGSFGKERIDSEEVRRLLTDVVSIDSVYPNEGEIVNFLEAWLLARGFSIERQEIAPGRANLLVQKGENPQFLLYGHVDTVPLDEDELKDWNSDPFKLTEKDGKLHGLGASDMKGGVVAIIEAASNSQTPVKILLAVDEENEGEGVYKAITERADFFKDVKFVISAEPNYGHGLNGITISRPGYSEFEVVARGTRKHIFRLDEADDAIEKLMKYGHRFYQKRKEIFKSPKTKSKFKRVFGESVGMSVAGEARGEIHVWWGPKDQPAVVLVALQKLAKEKGIEIKHKPGKTPDYWPYRSPKFPSPILAKIVEQKTGKELKYKDRKSVGDDNVLARLFPVYTWGASGGNEHAANEYVIFESVVTLAEMYKAFLDEVGKIDKPQPRNYLK